MAWRESDVQLFVQICRMCPATMKEGAQRNSWSILELSDPAKGRTSRALWEKWFQKLVFTALITYSALSFPPPFLTLPPSSLFISASTWLQFTARHLSLFHPPCGCSFLSVRSNGNWFFFSAYLSKSFCICLPNLFLFWLSDALHEL